MAKAETPAAQGENAAPPAGKKKKLLIIILAAVLLVVLAAGGAAVLLLGGKPAGEHAEEHVEEVEEAIPIYERLETFTVNLADQESYLQVEISLKLADAKVQQRLKARMPEVRDVLLRVLSSKTAEELITPEGKAELAKEVRKEANAVIGAKKADQGVKDVLFTSFIIQ
jgi:flagellar FliL protein